MALGIWLFLVISQIWSIGMPFGLLSLANGYRTAFLGNGGMGCMVLLLGIFVFARQEKGADTPAGVS
jgi:hypothetical protein